MTFEDFLQVRHPNHLKRLLFHESVKKENNCSLEEKEEQPGCLSDVPPNTTVTLPAETQPRASTACYEKDLSAGNQTYLRDCYSEDACDSYKEDTRVYSIEDICGCEKDTHACNKVDSDEYCIVDDNICPYCQAEESGYSLNEDKCYSTQGTGVSFCEETGIYYTETDIDDCLPEDLCDCCAEEISDKEAPILGMPRPRHASPGNASSGYDTDQDYMTWNETRMQTSKANMALPVSSKPNKYFKCKNGRIHSVGDEFVIKADALYHQNYASSSDNDYPVSRRVAHGISMRQSAMDEVQHCKRENARKGHAKTCRRATGEHSRLSRVKKTMKNIISDLESDLDLHSNDPDSENSEREKEPEKYIVPNESAEHVHRLNPDAKVQADPLQVNDNWESFRREGNHAVKHAISRDPKRENILQWQCRVQDLDRVPSNEFHNLDLGEHERNAAPDDTAPIKVNNTESDTLLDGITHSHSHNTSDLDYRTVQENSNLSMPYQPCSTGSISSDSGMASFATGEYSTDYDVYSWGSPVHVMDKSISKTTDIVEQEENIYETIPDELVYTGEQNHYKNLGLNSAFSFYNSSNKRNSICSDTTSHTYASIDANSVTSDYECPEPPALPARNYRRMAPISPAQFTRKQQGQYQPKPKTPIKKQLHLDDIVKASDIVDMSGPHMYTVHDVLESFERLAGNLPDEPQVEAISNANNSGKLPPVYHSTNTPIPHPEQGMHQGNQIPKSFGAGISGPFTVPRHVEKPSNVSLSDSGDTKVKSKGSYKRGTYTCLDTPADPLMTPKRYPRDFNKSANTWEFSPEHKYMTPHACSNKNNHMTPMKECHMIHDANHHNLGENGWQCVNGNNVSIFELRGTYC